MSRKFDLMRSVLLSDPSDGKVQQAQPAAPRPTQVPAVVTKPIQFRVSATMFEEFSEQAVREFGFSKGAKSFLFQKIWIEYREKFQR